MMNQDSHHSGSFIEEDLHQEAAIKEDIKIAS
jgi:hypothetical protein